MGSSWPAGCHRSCNPQGCASRNSPGRSCVVRSTRRPGPLSSLLVRVIYGAGMTWSSCRSRSRPGSRRCRRLGRRGRRHRPLAPAEAFGQRTGGDHRCTAIPSVTSRIRLQGGEFSGRLGQRGLRAASKSPIGGSRGGQNVELLQQFAGDRVLIAERTAGASKSLLADPARLLDVAGTDES